MMSPWEGRNHGVTMGRWKPQSHQGKVETTGSPWKMKTTESPWEGGNHRVTMGRWKP